MTGLFLVALTLEERNAALMALHARSENLDAVRQLASTENAQLAATSAQAVTRHAADKLRAADETGQLCRNCGRAVPPADSAAPFCSEVCWSAAIAAGRT